MLYRSCTTFHNGRLGATVDGPDDLDSDLLSTVGGLDDLDRDLSGVWNVLKACFS